MCVTRLLFPQISHGCNMTSNMIFEFLSLMLVECEFYRKYFENFNLKSGRFDGENVMLESLKTFEGCGGKSLKISIKKCLKINEKFIKTQF